MKIDFKGLMEGLKNSIFVKEEIEKLAKERTDICKGCSHNSDHQKQYNNYKTLRPDFHCTVCGCDLHMKTRCLACACPINKWLAQMTEDEEIQLDMQIKKEEDVSGKDK